MLRKQARAALPLKQKVLVNILAVLAAIVASMICLLFMKLNPFEVYQKIFVGSLGTAYRFHETVNKAIPLTVLSLGTCIAFKMKFWNIGQEGQFYMGAFGATWVVMLCPNLPKPVMLLAMAVMGFVFGGLFALIPAGLKTKWGTSETLVTLMLNYVAQKWVGYLQYGPWRDPNGGNFPRIARFAKNAILPKVGGIHIGWIIAIVLAVILYFILTKTKFGYEISVIGESRDTAKYAGINVTKTMIFAVIVSGGLCGLAGMMQASAIENTLCDNLSNGLGFTAVITTHLSHLNPIVSVVVSFLFSMLLQGGSYLQSALQVPAAIGNILQGVIIFFVLGAEFFIKYKLVWVKKEDKSFPDTDHPLNNDPFRGLRKQSRNDKFFEELKNSSDGKKEEK